LRSKPHADPRRLRQGFLEYLQRLRGEVGEQTGQPCDVAAGPRQTRHVPDADGVGMDGEHDGDCLGHLSDGLHLGRRHREDGVDIHSDQFGREFRQLIDPFCPPELNDNALALDVAEIAQARPQRLDSVSVSRSGTETQEPDPRNLRRLLRTHGERPSDRCADNHFDERAPSHAALPRAFSTMPNAG
jgi:hypothetical protein